MTHYDVLGVGRDATADEIRGAYLARARTAHPDVAGAAGDADMRRINLAWAVLGDDKARREYDRTLRIGAGQGDGGGKGGGDDPTTDEAAGLRINRPDATPFVPYHPDDEDDDDRWRYTDDDTDPETAPGAALQLGPMLIVAVGFAVAILGAVVGQAPVTAIGAVVVVLGFVAFLIVPMLVMARASSVEEHRTRSRRR